MFDPTYNDLYSTRRLHYEIAYTYEDEGSLLSLWEPDLRLLGSIETLGAEEALTARMRRMEKLV